MNLSLIVWFSNAVESISLLLILLYHLLVLRLNLSLDFNDRSEFFLNLLFKRVTMRIFMNQLNLRFKRTLFSSESKLIQISFLLKLLATIKVQHLPFSPNFFHYLQCWHAGVFILNSFSCFSYENHISWKALLRSCCFDFSDHFFRHSNLTKRFQVSVKSLFV